MALLTTWKNLLKKVRAPRVAFKLVWNELTELDSRIDDVESGVVAAGSISETELANGAVTESKLGTGAVTSGKLGNGSVATAKLADDAVTQDKIADDAVGAGQLDTVERDITIAAEAAAGSVTNEADINGVILGVYPQSACAAPIKDVTFTPGTGAIQVELMSAQPAETPAVVTVVVLQTPPAA